MKKNILLFIVMSGLFFVVPVPAQAGWLEFFFPTLRQKGPDPMDTLQAPFAVDPNAKPPAERPDPAKAILPENNTPMDQPHRDNNEISAWLTNTLSETMTFDSPDYNVTLQGNAEHFSPDGYAQYRAFLVDNNILKVLQSDKFQVRGFVEDLPLLLNEGAVNGVYRWLYEVPMMVSYMERGVKDYKKLQPVNQKIVVTVQIGRMPGQQTGPAILIERWDGKAQKLDTKK